MINLSKNHLFINKKRVFFVFKEHNEYKDIIWMVSFSNMWRDLMWVVISWKMGLKITYIINRIMLKNILYCRKIECKFQSIILTLATAFTSSGANDLYLTRSASLSWQFILVTNRTQKNLEKLLIFYFFANNYSRENWIIGAIFLSVNIYLKFRQSKFGMLFTLTIFQ